VARRLERPAATGRKRLAASGHPAPVPRPAAAPQPEPAPGRRRASRSSLSM
jgi:hypothetical protein